MPYTFKRDTVLSLKSQLQNFVPALMALLSSGTQTFPNKQVTSPWWCECLRCVLSDHPANQSDGRPCRCSCGITSMVQGRAWISVAMLPPSAAYTSCPASFCVSLEQVLSDAKAL